MDQPSFVKLSEALTKHVDIDIVKKFSREEWSQTGSNGEHLIHIAAKHGHLPAIKFFLLPEIGLDANGADNHGRTPLHYVGKCSYNIVAVTDLLLQKGANLFAADNDGNTPAHAISNSRFVSKELYHCWVSCVVKQGRARVFQLRNKSRKTPMHTAIEILDVSQATIELILSNSTTTIDEPDLNGDTVLMLGVYSGRRRKTLKQIVELGGNPHKVNLQGNGVLHYAVDAGNLDALKYFLSIGVDINRRNGNDETPMHRLQYTKQNFVAITLLLIEQGVDIYGLNSANDNIAHLLSQNQVINGNEYHDWVDAMIKIGHNQLFQIKGTHGNTPLQFAVQTKEVCGLTFELLHKVLKVDPSKVTSDVCTVLQNAHLPEGSARLRNLSECRITERKPFGYEGNY